LVPIRKAEPIGAIGNYWASPHAATERELQLLQALADSTSVAMENVKVYAELEQRVKDRTAELERANRDLESFSSAVSHDLRAPLRHIAGYSSMMADLPPNSPRAAEMLGRIQAAAGRMNVLIDDMLKLARISMSSVPRRTVDLSALASEILTRLQQGEPNRRVLAVVAPGLKAEGDIGWIRIALENLLANAWKFTSKQAGAEIEVGITASEPREFFVRDNGSGFDMRFADRLFHPFSRLHAQSEFPGNGIGLATIRRIVEKHGGSIRAESEVDKGARFYFTLGPRINGTASLAVLSPVVARP
jgi:signal transduction histidine kinase